MTHPHGRRLVAAVLTAATAVAALSGCSGRGLQREAEEDAKLRAVDTVRTLEMLARQNAGASAGVIVATMDEELDDGEVVSWWERTETGADSATWRTLHVGAAQETGIGGSEWATAVICTEATVTFATGQVATSDIDCPEDADIPSDAVDVDLGDLAD